MINININEERILRNNWKIFECPRCNKKWKHFTWGFTFLCPCGVLIEQSMENDKH